LVVVDALHFPHRSSLPLVTWPALRSISAALPFRPTHSGDRGGGARRLRAVEAERHRARARRLDGERRLEHREQIDGALAVRLGGRTAEELTFGAVSTGVQNTWLPAG
jgi:hypothetical protein